MSEYLPENNTESEPKTDREGRLKLAAAAILFPSGISIHIRPKASKDPIANNVEKFAAYSLDVASLGFSGVLLHAGLTEVTTGEIPLSEMKELLLQALTIRYLIFPAGVQALHQLYSVAEKVKDKTQSTLIDNRKKSGDDGE